MPTEFGITTKIYLNFPDCKRTFNKVQKVMGRCMEGERLLLRKDRDVNRFMVCDFSGRELGYVNQLLSRQINRLMNNEIEISITIHKVYEYRNSNGGSYYKILAEIYADNVIWLSGSPLIVDMKNEMVDELSTMSFDRFMDLKFSGSDDFFIDS